MRTKIKMKFKIKLANMLISLEIGMKAMKEVRMNKMKSKERLK